MSDRLKLAEALGEFSHDPLGFVYFAFPWGEGELKGFAGPDKWQIDVLKSLRDDFKNGMKVFRRAVASGHGVGKSALVAWVILWAMSTHENTRGVVTANTENQLKTKTWNELYKWYRLFIGKDFFQFTASDLRFSEKKHERSWRIDMVPWSERNTEAFAGLHNKGERIIVVFDEASSIPDSVWEVTEGALSDEGTEIFWFVFGNPTRNSGRFFDCFNKSRHRWHSFKVDSRTAQMTNKVQINEWLTDYGEDSDFFRVRVKGEFPSSSDMQFISSDIVYEAQKVLLRPEQVAKAPVILGVDPAWTGSDEFVVFLRQGLYSKLLYRVLKNDDDGHMAGIIARFEDEYKANAVNIDKGYGTGLYSFGKQMGRSWFLVDFAGKPIDDFYLNKRAEMWGEMKKWLVEGGGIEKDDVLASDLTAPEGFINARGKFQLESKDSMKRRGVPSPNRADALALTFARRIRYRNNIGLVKKDYDPFKGM